MLRPAALLLLLLGSSLATPALAQEEDEDGFGFGPLAGTTEAEQVPVGFLMGSVNGDTGLWMWWANSPDEQRIRLQAWEFGAGAFGPTADADEDDGALSGADPSEDWFNRREEPEEEVEQSDSPLVAAPRFRFGGDRQRGERFGLILDGTWLLNLSSYADIPVRRFHAGPLFGAGLRIHYSPKDADDRHATGGVHLVGGLTLGGRLARVLTLRAISRVRWDPFVQDELLGEGGALVGLDLHHVSVPLGLQISGVATQELTEDLDPGWRASVALLYVPL